MDKKIVNFQVICHCSLAVRDLSNLVKPCDFIGLDHLTTLLTIVPSILERIGYQDMTHEHQL